MATTTPRSSGPRIEITPSPSEYRQLVSHLRILREAGAETNTAAILAAVKDAATEGKMQGSSTPKRTRGARQRSPSNRPAPGE